MDEELEQSELDLTRKVKRDIEYIKNDILVKHKIKYVSGEKKYIKFSKALNAIAILDLTKEQYVKYWNTQYLHYPEIKKQIFKIIDEKFANGLTSKEEMLEILKNSKDIESERNAALKFLGEKVDNKEE